MIRNPDDFFSLSNKVVVITGAAGLLGRKHAEAVAAFGGIPVLLDVSSSGVVELATEIQEKFDVESVGYSVDITKEASVSANAETIIARFGHIDALINNAANNPKMEDDSGKNFSRLENFPLKIWNDDINVALTGSFLCAKYYGYEISKNPNGGSIVNISSDLGLIAPDQRLYEVEGVSYENQNRKPVSYSVVKTGIVGLTRYLATYWPEKNVRCNALCPGGVENGQPEVFIGKVSNKIPMGRMANANEYQGALIWLLSDQASYLNGAIIPIDGGRSVW
ncbi:MAG: SDR family oxidoreductase [Pseudomonadales bacterium]|nr:SDR family oxidoreductase [Pseudomonadales bacterium]